MLAHDAQMRESFRIIDRNHDGEISFDELATTLRQVSPTASKLTDDELRAVFTRIDTRHDGVISYAEWVSAVYLLPTASVEAGSKRLFVFFVPLFLTFVVQRPNAFSSRNFSKTSTITHRSDQFTTVSELSLLCVVVLPSADLETRRPAELGALSGRLAPRVAHAHRRRHCGRRVAHKHGAARSAQVHAPSRPFGVVARRRRSSLAVRRSSVVGRRRRLKVDCVSPWFLAARAGRWASSAATLSIVPK